MELVVFTPEMEPIGIVDAITSLVWTRRYQTCGEFCLLVPFRSDISALLADGNLLMQRGDTECAQICYKHIRKSAQGQEEIEVQGKMLMSWLDRRVLTKQIISNGNTGQELLLRHLSETIIAPMDSKRIIPHVSIFGRASYADAKMTDYQSEEHANVKDSFESLLTAAKLGFRAITDPVAGTHAFDVFRGRDLTVSQTVTDPCVFSVEYENMGEQSYTSASENLRTTAYVYGADKEMVVGSEYAGLKRREMAVEASDIAKTYVNEKGTTVTLTAAQLLEALRLRGSEGLEQYLVENNFEGVINPFGATEYKTDFDIGDRVTCRYARWNVEIDVTITAIVETYQDNRTSITVTFGEGTPSLDKKIRQLANR